MLKTGGGAIVNTISDGIYGGMADNVAYQATKAGVSALTRHLARAYGKQRIRANSLSPGMVLTERNKRDVPQEQLDMVLAAIASDRHGKPEDLGAAAAFLLSDLAEWITGQVINVNGGGIMRA